MLIGDQEITRKDMPSYEIGGNYKDRMYQVYQDMYQRKYGQMVQGQPMEPQQTAPQPNNMAQ